MSAHLREELPVDHSLRPAAATPDGETEMTPPGLRGANLTALGDGETPLLSASSSALNCVVVLGCSRFLFVYQQQLFNR